MYRPLFVTNSSSSCMIVWEKNPDDYPDHMASYIGMKCPHCGGSIGAGSNTEKLEHYLTEEAREVVNNKLAQGCAIFYDIGYLGAFAEDEFEHGSETSGHYSFQC